MTNPWDNPRALTLAEIDALPEIAEAENFRNRGAVPNTPENMRERVVARLGRFWSRGLAWAMRNSSGVRVSVLAFGAQNDGQGDNVQAFQDAIDDVFARGGGEVFVPPGTYRMASPSGSIGGMVTLRSGVSIIGEGRSSRIVAADGLNTAEQDFRFFVHYQNGVLRDVVIRDLLIDCNGENNLVPAPPFHNRQNQAIYVDRGEDIDVIRVDVRNNPGRQCFAFGDNTSPHSCRSIRILDCTVRNVGRAVPGNDAQTDHSVIYLQADGATVRGCHFSNDTMASDATAYEIHCSNLDFDGNYARNFSIGVNVVAQVTDQEHATYRNCVFDNVIEGLRYWAFDGFTLRDVHCERITVVQSADAARDMVNLNAQVHPGSVVEGLTFSRCTFESRVADYESRLNGVILGRVRDVAFDRCRFRNLTGRGIAIGETLPDQTEIYIDDCHFEDCGRTSSAVTSARAHVAINSNDRLRRLRFRRNRCDGRYITTGNITAASPVITNVADTSIWEVGHPINGRGLAGGAYVIDVDHDAGTLTISSNATISDVGITLFQHGNLGLYSNAQWLNNDVEVEWNDFDEATIETDDFGAAYTFTQAVPRVVRKGAPVASANTAVRIGGTDTNHALVIQSIGAGVAQIAFTIGTAVRSRILTTADQVQLFAAGALRWTIRDTFLQPAGNYDIGSAGSGGIFRLFFGSAGGPFIREGVGAPEGVVSAPPGSLYLNRSAGASTTLYVKEAGTGNTGWIAK